MYINGGAAIDIGNWVTWIPRSTRLMLEDLIEVGHTSEQGGSLMSK